MVEKEKIPVAILGATGLVGQKAIALLEQHPNFYVKELVASPKRLGQTYGEAVCWRESKQMPSSVADMPFKEHTDITSKAVLSALPSHHAKTIEPLLTQKGMHVFSNASAWRMDKKVPILIPEINQDHLSLLEEQMTKGKLITNSNCTTAFIALALWPLMELGTLEHVSVVTLQAISGAGYPGIDSMDITGNIIPYIEGEEEKISEETVKILGTSKQPASFGITAHVHRVPVVHGHTIALHVHFQEKIDLEDVLLAYQEKNRTWPELYRLYKEPNRPQPARDIGPYDQSVHLGRLKLGAKNNILGLIAMGNNLVRGAAGASLRNMEAAWRHLV